MKDAINPLAWQYFSCVWKWALLQFSRVLPPIARFGGSRGRGEPGNSSPNAPFVPIFKKNVFFTIFYPIAPSPNRMSGFFLDDTEYHTKRKTWLFCVSYQWILLYAAWEMQKRTGIFHACQVCSSTRTDLGQILRVEWTMPPHPLGLRRRPPDHAAHRVCLAPLRRTDC